MNEAQCPVDVGQIGYLHPESKSPTSNDFSVQTLLEFVGDFRHTASQANNRVWLQSMYVLPSHGTNLLVDAFTQAAPNVDKRLKVDGLQGFLEHRHLGGDKLNHDGFRTALAHMRNTLSLSDVGMEVSRQLPIWKYPVFPKGRNHIKVAVVDDVAWLGCSNFGRDSEYDRHDYMIRVERTGLVTAIADLYLANPTQNYEIEDGDTKLLVDAGIVGKSLILDKAIGIVNDPNMTSFQMLTPWVPDGLLLEALRRRHLEGCDVQILTWYHPLAGHVEDIYSAIKRWNTIKMKLQGRNIPISFTNKEMHSKLLVASGQNKAQALATSHNYTRRGVDLGTAEAGLLTSNSGIIQQLNDYFLQVSSDIQR